MFTRTADAKTLVAEKYWGNLRTLERLYSYIRTQAGFFGPGTCTAYYTHIDTGRLLCVGQLSEHCVPLPGGGPQWLMKKPTGGRVRLDLPICGLQLTRHGFSHLRLCCKQVLRPMHALHLLLDVPPQSIDEYASREKSKTSKRCMSLRLSGAAAIWSFACVESSSSSCSHCDSSSSMLSASCTQRASSCSKRARPASHFVFSVAHTSITASASIYMRSAFTAASDSSRSSARPCTTSPTTSSLPRADDSISSSRNTMRPPARSHVPAPTRVQRACAPAQTPRPGVHRRGPQQLRLRHGNPQARPQRRSRVLELGFPFLCAGLGRI